MKTDGVCQECDGAGEFESALHCETCPACNGTGRSEPKDIAELRRKAALWDAINVLWHFPGKTLEQVLHMRARELAAAPPLPKEPA